MPISTDAHVSPISNESEALRTAVQIMSESRYGQAIGLIYGVDTFVSETLAMLQDNRESNYYFECFSVEDFFRVFTEAIDRIDRYDGTPETLHLYLAKDSPFIEDLKVQSGESLDDRQIRFIFLQVLRWFSRFPKSAAYRKHFGVYEPEWAEALESCDGSQDDPNTMLGIGSERNLTRLIHPLFGFNDFDYFQRILELLPSNRAKLEWAIERLADHEQTEGKEAETFRDEHGIERNSFQTNVRIEIRKLKKLAKLERTKPVADIADGKSSNPVPAGISVMEYIGAVPIIENGITIGYVNPGKDATQELESKRKQLEDEICELEKEYEKKLNEINKLAEEKAQERGLTVRRLLFLLYEEMSIFRDAKNNVARGEFGYMLTGLGGITKNGKKGETIRQDLSGYHRAIDEADREWLEGWRSRLKKVSRNKGGTL